MIRIGKVLVATLGDELDDNGALAFQDDIGRQVVEHRSTGVLLDISALDVVDSFICKVLGDTASIVSVLGARVALVGMRPAVAITLVELGLPLTGVETALNLEHGLRAVSRPVTEPDRGRPPDHVSRAR